MEQFKSVKTRKYKNLRYKSTENAQLISKGYLLFNDKIITKP